MDEVYVSDNNRYLDAMFSQIREEGLRDYLIRSLSVEHMFSKVTQVKYRGAPIYFERDDKKSIQNHFALTVSLKTAVEYILSFGLSDITLKSPDTKVFMSRELFVEKYELIKSTDNPRLKRSYQCLFDLWR